MTNFKRYHISDLLKAFADSGYPVSDRWVRRQIEKGNLILPRSVTSFRKLHLTTSSRKAGAVYEMSMEQIQATVKAFSPGGCGFYDYRKVN